MKYKLTFFSLFVVCLLLRIFCFEVYRIPSDSMSPTLLKGDWILVNKWTTGARLINFKELFQNKRLLYNRVFETPILKNDLVVFSFPIYTKELGATVYGQALVKRCYAVAGDTVVINRVGEDQSNITEFSLDPNTATLLYPYDKKLNWTVASYGPLWLPKKNTSILDDSTLTTWHYGQVLCMEEQLKQHTYNNRADSINLKPYVFLHNYYFMLGDNFYASQDSRFWGFVPDNHIIGITTLVLFSFDPSAAWYKSFMWNRLLKHVE